MLEYIFPFGRLIKLSQVRPHVSTEDAEGRRLANTIDSHETKDLACTRGWQSMQLEAVCTVAMSHLSLQTFGQVNNFDSLEGTSLNTHTTSVTQVLRDEADG